MNTLAGKVLLKPYLHPSVEQLILKFVSIDLVEDLNIRFIQDYTNV